MERAKESLWMDFKKNKSFINTSKIKPEFESNYISYMLSFQGL